MSKKSSDRQAGVGGERDKSHMAFLAAHPLFQRLSQRSTAFREFAAQVQLASFPKGDFVYRQAETPSHLYLVRDGEIHIEHRNVEKDEILLVGIEGRGAVFGEASLLTGEPRSSDARAALDSSVYLIPGTAFLQLMSREVAVAQALTFLLSRRLRAGITGEGRETPARVVFFTGPADPARAAQVAMDLSDHLVDENPDRVVLCALSRESLFQEQHAGASVADIMSRWPQITIDEIRGMLASREHRFHVLRGESLFIEDDRHHRLAAAVPGLLGRLRKYYSIILVDAGADYEHPVLCRILQQSDTVVLLNSLKEYGRREDERWKACVDHCDRLLSDFLDRLITVSDEPADTPVERIISMRNRHRDLYRRHIRIEQDPRGRTADRRSSYARGLSRLARHLSGSSRGLALGGGGARAFAHVGVLEVLEHEGMDFDGVAGTSMGAIIGAAHAMGKSAREIQNLLGQILPDSAAILDKTLPLVSFFRGKRLNQAILRGFGETRFEELELPFVCNAVDLKSGNQIHFDRGFLSTALRGSVSLPGVFPPLKMGEYDIVDGGVINNLPGDILRERGYAIILGLNATPMTDTRSSRTDVRSEAGAFGFLRGLRRYLELPPILGIMYRSIAMEGRELMRFRKDTFDLVLEPDVAGFDVFDFHEIDRIVDRGREVAEKHLPELRATMQARRLQAG
ncbi:MAG: patatin-like phospholipase family protein [Spirochaetales bacterium]|nr:patatin-like phospholipase family protein [Spirochaetales bacterium]